MVEFNYVFATDSIASIQFLDFYRLSNRLLQKYLSFFLRFSLSFTDWRSGYFSRSIWRQVELCCCLSKRTGFYRSGFADFGRLGSVRHYEIWLDSIIFVSTPTENPCLCFERCGATSWVTSFEIDPITLMQSEDLASRVDLWNWYSDKVFSFAWNLS